ncbi:hypothetical protein GCM10017750_17680 [Streptomyces racemochromogenes]
MVIDSLGSRRGGATDEGCSFKAPEEAGGRAPQGLPASGRAPSTAIRRISETFGSYKARAGPAVCLGNYSDFLVSEMGNPPEGAFRRFRFRPSQP